MSNFTEQEPAHQIIERVQKMMKARNAIALEMVRRELLRGDPQSKKMREARDHLITDEWREIAHMLGPTLISLSCEAVGGPPQMAFPIAASLVLITTGIRIHDDIIDNSTTKRSRLTIFGRFGITTAMGIGDILITKGYALLHKVSEKEELRQKVTHIVTTIHQKFRELGTAEAQLLNFRGAREIPPQTYMDAMKLKAAVYEAQTRVGGIIGGGTEKEVARLGEYGRSLGTLLIIRDEFIDMFEADELQHRIKNECIPLPLVYVLQNPESREKIVAVLKKDSIGERDIDTLVDITFSSAEIRKLRKQLRALRKKAEHSIEIFSKKIRITWFNLLLEAALKDL